MDASIVPGRSRKSMTMPRGRARTKLPRMRIGATMPIRHVSAREMSRRAGHGREGCQDTSSLDSPGLPTQVFIYLRDSLVSLLAMADILAGKATKNRTKCPGVGVKKITPQLNQSNRQPVRRLPLSQARQPLPFHSSLIAMLHH